MNHSLTHYAETLSTQIQKLAQSQREVCHKIATIVPRLQLPQEQTLHWYHESLWDIQENIEQYRDFLESHTPLQVSKEEIQIFDTIQDKIIILQQHVSDMKQVCGNMNIAPIPPRVKNLFSQILMILCEIPETIEEIQEHPVVFEAIEV